MTRVSLTRMDINMLTRDLQMLPAHIFSKASKVKLLLMYVDGVLTDSKILYITDNEKPVEVKAFSSKDGLGLYLLNQYGISTGVISGRKSPSVEERARILKFKHVYQGHMDKEESFKKILDEEKLDPSEVCFIGDDFHDGPLVAQCGLGVAVGNAVEELKSIADYVTRANGGEGAVREVCDLILKTQGYWEEVLNKYKLIKKK